MKLSELLPALRSHPTPSLDVEGLHYDSRKIRSGFVFFAVPGFKEDGTKYVQPAFAKGAVAAVVKRGSSLPQGFEGQCVEVDDVRRALAEASARFYDYPGKKMRLFGVTGTKGKTSSVYILESIFRAAGKRTALLGTVEVRHPGRKQFSEKTTMESLDLQAFLSEALQARTEVAVLEISSHALSLDRVWGLEFEGVLFTNLSEDHLDFYGDMEKYFQAKKILFAPPYRKPDSLAVTNCDEPYGQRMAKECPGRWLTFGRKGGDFRISHVKVTARANTFTLEGPGVGTVELQSRLVGNFSIPNAAGAATLALGAGLGVDPVKKGVAEAYVPGRLDQVETSLPFSVFVDYAHMGHALENVLESLRGLCKGRLILVFGAGGDRPPDRRTQMGAVAARCADFTVITSDNPRTEDPMAIISAIEGAFRSAGGKDFRVEPDRKAAIALALAEAKDADVVCIAGKGHEAYQIIGKQTLPFDDKICAAAALRELEKKQGVDTAP
ncbi:MAG TPA: UDP-N-acetylmuramoyl-L-alanyl-D-glutamate--2,6-diaminopimelate ligase [Bdellovibrionota bacterium]|jgi:UDP-N-acetylmuramoyl-L-alanyl-D-glutamate--2,6-diaminopimelate ligase